MEKRREEKFEIDLMVRIEICNFLFLCFWLMRWDCSSDFLNPISGAASPCKIITGKGEQY